jgi:hypothetical protein
MRTQRLLIMLSAVWLTCVGAAADTGSKLPSEITTRDGRTFHGVAGRPVAVYPDGIVVSYTPEARGEAVPGGIGTAKLRFSNLPDDVQKQYSYDAKAASEYETQQAQANDRWFQAQAAEERAIIRYRNLAELNRSLAGDADASYSAALDANGKVSAQGYARPTPTQVIESVNVLSHQPLPPRNPLFNWPEYVPVPGASTTVVVPK